MKLFKNVGLPELKAILKDGILPIAATGNDNWEESNRSNNSKDVVYLFSPKTELNTFMQYGLVLLELETKNAVKTEFMLNDVNKDYYDEFIKDKIEPNEIKKIYIPKIFKRQIDKTDFLKDIENKIIWVDLKDLPTKEELEDYKNTVNVEFLFNYLRGWKNVRKEKRFFCGEFIEVEATDGVIELRNQNTIIF